MWGIHLEFLFIMGLAAFRLTRLIVIDKITEFIRSPFFDEVEEDGVIYLQPKEEGMKKWIGTLLDCYWCTGVWVSAGLLAFYEIVPSIAIPFILTFAIAAIGSIIEVVISKLLDV
jgi:hypothetical protein